MPPPLALPSEFVVLDTETSGMHVADGHSIVELAGQKIRGRAVVAEFVELISPRRALDPAASRVHGITELELAAHGRDHAEVIPRFLAFLGDAPIVAHNVGFDVAFLNAHCRQLGLPDVANRTIDTVELARQLLLLSSYSLGSVARFLKVPQPQAHRALADVVTVREVLFKLADRSAPAGHRAVRPPT